MKRYLALAIFTALNSFLIKASGSDSKKAGEPQKYESHWDNPLFSPLFYHHDLKTLKDYLEAGGSASAKLDPLDQTLLQYAAYFGAANIFNYLLEHGADSTFIDEEGLTTLMWAAHFNAVQYAWGAYDKVEPATQAKVEIINELFKRHLAQVNAQDKEGRTALHIAVESVSYPMQELQFPIFAALLKNGARIDIQNNKAETVLDIIKPSLSFIAKIKLVGMQGQPTFFEAWFKADTKEERGKVMIYLLNAIKEQIKDHTKQKQAKESLDNFKKFFHDNRFRISEYARELIAQRIKEIEQ